MKKLSMLAVVAAISSPVTALIGCAACRLLWGWFLAAEYGDGPSNGAWFGVSTILGMIVQASTPRKTGDGSQDTTLSSLVGSIATRWATIGLVLVVARFVGAVCGWIR